MTRTSPALVDRPERLRLVGQRRRTLAMMHQRLMLGMLIYAGIIAIIIVRIGGLAIFGGGDGRIASMNNVSVARADIVGREQIPLASSIEAWTIAVQPQRVIGSKMALAEKLESLMPERDAGEYYDILTSEKTFVYLRRRAAPSLVEAVNALGEPGIAFDRERDRLYPQTALASHVLGFTDIDGKGAAGVERSLDAELTDAGRDGAPIELSISTRVQQALEHELGSAMTHFSAQGAAGVLMDLKTFEILAMTSLPDFNPNDPAGATPEQMFNRATLGVYELGSTYKPFTVAMAMDAGIITSLGQMYSCPDKLDIYGRTIRDTHPYGRPCSVTEIMKESSNIGTAAIADQLGTARQKAFLKKMGFLDPVPVELKERGRTIAPGNGWGPLETVTVGYGHGIAVTPLHLAMGYATLFNGGVYHAPTILRRSKANPLDKGRRVFTEDTSYRMRALLRLVVTQGTGKKADAEGYRVGGKTGTAEKVINGRYSRRNVVNTFAGVFPIEDPRYVIVVMLDDPQPTKETYGFRTAGWNVAPVVKKTVERVGPMLGVAPDKTKEPKMAEVLPFIHDEK